LFAGPHHAGMASRRQGAARSGGSARTSAAPGAALAALPPGVEAKLVEVSLPALEMELTAVHVPCGGRWGGQDDRVRFFRRLEETARRRAGGAHMILGDFNAGRHRLDEEGATFTCTRSLGMLATLGYADAWRALHPGGREYTWFSHDGSGFRID